jgi:hypothetical protein
LSRQRRRLLLPILLEIARRKAWFPVGVFVFHTVLMTRTAAYQAWPSLDRPMHALGGLAMAYFLGGCLDLVQRRGLVRPVDPLLEPLVIVSATCTVAVFWEFAEHASDLMLDTRFQAGLGDTLLDLLLGLAGCLAYLAGRWAGR